MIPEIQNFAFEEHLVRIVMRDSEPWFVGVDVCRAMALAKPDSALKRLDDDEKYTLTEGVINDQRGPNVRLVISEPGLYRLIFSSRKEEAERFKRWIAHDVLPSLRKHGFYAMPSPQDLEDEPDNRIASSTERRHAIDLVREYRLLFGNERARQLWQKIGLPHIITSDGPLLEATDNARACLALILSHKFMVDDVELTIRTELDNAFNGGICARDELEKLGIKIDTEMDGFYLANRNIKLDWIFSGTAWENSRWNQTLKNLPGTMTGKKFYFAGKLSRCLFIPVEHLDYPAMVLN
jgi:prophage antirepressor-like protein